MDELRRIRLSRIKKQGIENDIKSFLKNLETDKNLLLFFPYVFYFAQEYNNGKEIIMDSLQKDFCNSFKYRQLKCPDYATYFVTLYNNEFLLMKVEEEILVLLDEISTTQCATFIDLESYEAF